jgi:hypothetical protein
MAELHALALRLGIVVRVERLAGGLAEARGGLCKIGGRPLVFMADALPLADQIDILVTALSTFDLESVYVSPFVRARIDAARRD